MGGVANVFTKVGDGNALALMVAKANVFTHVGDGLTVALMLAKATWRPRWATYDAGCHGGQLTSSPMSALVRPSPPCWGRLT